MDDTAARLTRCFTLAFPALTPAAIPAASAQTVANWDSLAHITLLTLIGEEFDLSLDFEDLESATSFAALLNVLQSQ